MKSMYAFSGYDKEKMARVIGRDLSMSTKAGIEICNFIRRKDLQKTKAYLEAVLKKEKAIPFKRFCNGAGHKPGMGAGKYPIKACKHVLNLVKSAEANASMKGLNTSSLKIIQAVANQASRPMKYGRATRGEMKRSHVEIVVMESETKTKKQVKAKKADSTKEKKEATPKEDPVKAETPKVKKDAPAPSAEKAKEPASVIKEEAKAETKKEDAPKKSESKQETKTPSEDKK